MEVVHLRESLLAITEIPQVDEIHQVGWAVVDVILWLEILGEFLEDEIVYQWVLHIVELVDKIFVGDDMVAYYGVHLLRFTEVDVEGSVIVVAQE